VLSVIATGLVLGVAVAAPLGPVGLLAVRTSVRFGFSVGLGVGLGAAVIDTTYAALGLLGAASLLQWGVAQLTLGLVGAAVLVGFGLRTLHSALRVRLGGEVPDEVQTPGRAFRVGLVATASNPLTVLTWAALLGAAVAVTGSGGPLAAVTLLLGVFVGSAGWFMALTWAAAHAGRRMSDRVLGVVDLVAGAGLLAFGAALGIKTVRDAA
jgi:putative LysE/RhtB family amino acid efflux pump